MAKISREQVAGGIMLAVGLMLTVIFAANLLPPAFDDWFATNVTQGWGGITAALWPFVPPVVILALIFYFLNLAFDIV